MGPRTLRVKILYDLRTLKYHNSQGMRYLGRSRKIVVSTVGELCEFWALFEKVLSAYIQSAAVKELKLNDYIAKSILVTVYMYLLW